MGEAMYRQTAPQSASQKRTSQAAARTAICRQITVALIFLSSFQWSSAAVISVNVLDSSTIDDGGCSLREAIMAANSDLATGGCPAGSGADTIELTGDVELTVEDSFQTGTPSILGTITIRGYGHSISRNAAAEFRIFRITETGDLTLKGVTVNNGGGATFAADGGGILNLGKLRANQSNFFNNSVDTSNVWGGGAIFSDQNSTLRVEGSSFTFNDSDFGGAINSNYGSTTTIADSTFVLNTSNGWGGAIYNGATDSILSNSTLWANSANYGGGIANYGNLIAINSTFSGNTVTGAGGGIFTDDYLLGTVNQTVTLSQVTFSGNAASSTHGAAIFVYSGTPSIDGSIIAQSTGENCLIYDALANAGNNVADDTSCGSIPGTLDVSKFDSVISDNGGLTRTHALLVGSNAINAAGNCGLPRDQRGGVRDSACDIGAYEFGADDRYEPSGPGGDDDSCYGHHILFGQTERHLHTSDFQDWVWFQPIAGATYAIETSNLIGGSDTTLYLWRDCTTQLAQDDDGGDGVASKISHVATPDDEAGGLNVLVLDYFGITGPRRGYDLTVACVAGPCQDCKAAGGVDFVLNQERIGTFREIEACNSISVLDTKVETGGAAVLRAGDSVALKSNFRVDAGGTMAVEIDSDLK